MGHSVHANAPLSEYIPAPQSTQSVEDEALVEAEYDPAGHWLHKCADAYWPAGHDVWQALVPAAENCPTGQGAHEVLAKVAE